MRKFILGAAAALLLSAVPGMAAAATGYVGAAYGHSSVDPGGNDIDVGAVDGVVAFDYNKLGVQLGAGYANINPDNGGDADDWHVDAHLYSRNDQWQWGGAVAYSNIDGGGDSSDEWTVAAEARFFQPHTTWGVALSYSDANDADLSEVALDGDVRHFLTDNFALAANVGLGDVDLGAGDDNVTEWNAGVGAEYQFASVPVSVFGGYEHTDFDTDADTNSDSVNIGVRWNFGGSLFDRDRSGANLEAPRGVAERLFGL